MIVQKIEKKVAEADTNFLHYTISTLLDTLLILNFLNMLNPKTQSQYDA